MSRLLSLLVVIGGLAVCFSWFMESSRDRDLAVVTAIAPQGEATVMASPSVGAASPTAPVATPTPAPTAQPKAAQRVSPAPVLAPRQDIASSPVTPPMPAPVPLPARRDVRTGGMDQQQAPKPQPMSRGELIVQLQRELRRVGCYAGEISGDWSLGSKRAMASFVARVNAALPVEQPDTVLLALVQSQHGMVCGRDCPAGEVMAEGGQCLPKAVMAQTHKTPAPWTTVVKAPTQPQVAPWTTTAQREPQIALAPQAAPTVGSSQIAPMMPAAEPLPGRMAMGAPLPSTLQGIAAPGYDTPGQPPAIVIYQQDSATAAPAPYDAPRFSAPAARPGPPPVKKAKSFKQMPAWAMKAFGQ